MVPRPEYTAYQQNLLKRYYENLDVLMLQKLQELVTEIYLANSETRRNRLWERVEKAMTKLQVPSSIASHIIQQRSVEILASNLQDWLKYTGKQ